VETLGPKYPVDCKRSRHRTWLENSDTYDIVLLTLLSLNALNSHDDLQ
jgi:hypothetical protein